MSGVYLNPNARDAQNRPPRKSKKGKKKADTERSKTGNSKPTENQNSTTSTSNAQVQDVPPESSQTHRITDVRREHWVNAYVNGTLVRVFPDNGSALNLISEAYVRLNKLEVDDDTKTTLRLPYGKVVVSTGSLKVLFAFANEYTVYTINCVILPGCVHDFVLSGKFFPDTGSDVNVILESHATALGLSISPDMEKTILECIDGSQFTACGIIRNAEWRFGKVTTTASSFPPVYQKASPNNPPLEWEFGTNATHGNTFVCDFYVVKTLTVPVILSANLLYGTNAFTACAEHITQRDHYADIEQPDYPEVAVVRKAWEARFGKHRKGNTTTNGVLPSTSTMLLSADDELRRHLEEDERITSLPEHEQDAARQAEEAQQQKWRDAHAKQSSIAPPSTGASSSQQSPST
ncbi:hypothetical protein CC80DRAFT_561306 [Byssothecium circinans]|uniref:Uncharacterized protein n=1 Tax=Byssothecium circinans TaxID=147558 RepID=A0A6A5TX40_9PLEO|nr:hypothetical protein CC80DRAFT_561306 [Byssothecium circinans]